MNEMSVELALEIMQLKIVQYIKNFDKEKDVKQFEEGLKELIKDREAIYQLDEEAINKAYDVYLKDIRKVK